jgi:hypothetical protein
MACEAVIEMGWENFVQVGLAFAQIRKDRLYKEEYDSFETYCQAKWQYGRRYVNRLISAAELVTYLGTNCSLTPEHEGQVRPLIELPPEQAKVAWENSAKKAAGGKITARLVERCVCASWSKPRRRLKREFQSSCGRREPSSGS